MSATDGTTIQPFTSEPFSATTLPSGTALTVDNPVGTLQPSIGTADSSTAILTEQLIRSTNPNYALVNDQPLTNQFNSPLNTFNGIALSRLPNDNIITTVPDLADINITSTLSRVKDSTTYFDVLPTDNNPGGIISEDEVAAAIEFRNSFKSGSPLTAYTKFYQSVENNYFNKPVDLNSSGGFSNDTILFWVRKFFALPELTKFLSATYAFTNKLKTTSQLNQLHLNLVLAKYQINTNSFFRCYSDSIGMLANSKYHQLDSTQPIFDIAQQSYGVPIPFSANMENKIGPVARNLMFNLSKGCTALYRRNLMGIAYYNAVNVDNFEVSSQVAHSLNLVNDIAFFVQFHKSAQGRMQKVKDTLPAFSGKLFQFVQYISNIGNRCGLNLRDVYHPLSTDRDFTSTPGSTDLAVGALDQDVIDQQINEFIQYENNDAASLQNLYSETANLQTSPYVIDKQLIAQGSSYYIDQQVFPGYDANGNPVYYNLQGQEVQWKPKQGFGPYVNNTIGNPLAGPPAAIIRNAQSGAITPGGANLQKPGTYQEVLPSGKVRTIVVENVNGQTIITTNEITRNNDGNKIIPKQDTNLKYTASGIANDDKTIPVITVTKNKGLKVGDIVWTRAVTSDGKPTNWTAAMVGDVGGTTYGTGEVGYNTLSIHVGQLGGMVDPSQDFGGPKNTNTSNLKFQIAPTNTTVDTTVTRYAQEHDQNNLERARDQVRSAFLNATNSLIPPDGITTSPAEKFTPPYQSAAAPAPQVNTTIATADRPQINDIPNNTSPSVNLPPAQVNGNILTPSDIDNALNYVQSASTRLFSNRQRIIPFTFQIRTEDIDGSPIYLNVDYLLKKVVLDNSDPNKAISTLKADKYNNNDTTTVPGQGRTIEYYSSQLSKTTSKNKSLTPGGIDKTLQRAGVSRTNPIYGKLYNQLLKVYEQRALTGNTLTQAVGSFINLASSRIPTNLLANITRSTGAYDNIASKLSSIAGTSLIPGSSQIFSALNPFKYININLSGVIPSVGLGSLKSIASVASQVATSGPPTSVDGAFELLAQVKDLICNFELPFINIDNIKMLLKTKFKPGDIWKAIKEEEQKILQRIGDFFKPENIYKNIWKPIEKQIKNYLISLYKKLFVCDENAKQNKTGKPKALFGLPTPK